MNAGYAFVNGVEDRAPVVSGIRTGGESGFATGLQGQYWGEGKPSARFIASYNLGAEYLWARLRATRQGATLGGSPFGVGAEVSAQGNGTSPSGDVYRALQVGPVAEFALTRSLRILGAVGGKTDNQTGTAEWFPYFKLEFVRIP